ncbi:MAG: pyridoxamine 5'-phosphate oxidase [Bacteroidetes bacterium]|nr:pyridoxamine 5'-phosphate oxidase [Bacteroidota bacterium]
MISSKQLADIRQDYTLKTFSEEDVLENPLEQFKLWLHEAITAQVHEPNAMTLSTLRFDGRPTGRVVLLKGLNEEGLVFYTNYDSDKGKQLMSNPFASLVFFWPELQRQIRVEGHVKKVTEKESDEYFFSRPIESQIGAHASPQSQPLEGRHVIEERLKELQELFKEKPLIRPRHWGGYVLIPDQFEFWQGRASRLHDRFRWTLKPGEKSLWDCTRLAP